MWLCSPDSSQMRRGSENGAAQRRCTDDSSVSGGKHQEPCHVALWFADSSIEQVTYTHIHIACILAGMGRLWSIQCLPTQPCHSMIDTSHGVDFSFVSFCHACWHVTPRLVVDIDCPLVQTYGNFFTQQLIFTHCQLTTLALRVQQSHDTRNRHFPGQGSEEHVITYLGCAPLQCLLNSTVACAL